MRFKALLLSLAITVFLCHLVGANELFHCVSFEVSVPETPSGDTVFVALNVLDWQTAAGCDMMLDYLQQERWFTLGENLVWFFDQDAWHSERAWSGRLWRPLTFMFGTEK